MKKKIFFLINSMEMGGAERVLSEIAPYLAKKYDVTIYTLKDSKSFYKINDDNVIINPLTDSKNNLSMLFSFPIALKRFRKILHEEKPHKVISFLELGNFINILSNDKAIISLRTSFGFLKGIKGIIYKHYIKKLYPRAKVIIVNSEENKAELTKNISIEPNKIHIIRNSIDITKVNKLKKERLPSSINKMLKDKRIFVTAGRIIKEKNQDKIIDAFYRLEQKNPGNVLIILGDGPLKKELQQKIVDLKLEQNAIIISGEHNIFKYLNRADYFVYASQAEGFPNVLLEAMTIGLPIITSDFKTGARELIDPSLPFGKKIDYPYYGPNGVLIPLEKFEEKFLNVVRNRRPTQKKVLSEKYDKKLTLKSWIKILE